MTVIGPPASWDEACARIVDAYARTTAPIAGDISQLEVAIDKLRMQCQSSVSVVEPDLNPLLFRAIGRESCGHLKSLGKWDQHGINTLLVSKQHDYGHQNIATFGLFGLVVRLSDKVARLRNLYGRDSARNESIIDTWSDLFGYSVIAEMWMDGTFHLDLAGEASDAGADA